MFTSRSPSTARSQTPMTEELTPQPEDPYGIAKYAVELDLKAAHEMFGLDYVVFRPHNVYGERQNIADRYRNVIGIFMNQVLQGQPMTVFGDGRRRAPSPTSTTSRPSSPAPARRGAQQPDVQRRRRHALHGPATGGGSPPRLACLPDRTPPGPQRGGARILGHSKVQRVFGMHPQVNCVRDLMRLAASARVRGPMPQVVFNDIEVRKRLPLRGPIPSKTMSSGKPRHVLACPVSQGVDTSIHAFMATAPRKTVAGVRPRTR